MSLSLILFAGLPALLLLFAVGCFSRPHGGAGGARRGGRPGASGG